jgi:hypothetical protein
MTDTEKFSADEMTEFFEYLDDFRDSDATNMFGAGRNIQKRYALTRNEARNVIGGWMDTFSQNLTADKRAEKFLKQAGATQ